MIFQPSFESLYSRDIPKWFTDAKFGIWSHWGPQSVPMYGDWYARNMYLEGSPQYLYHLRHYGHPSKFGYKDLCKLWKAEKFDPEGLMELYYKAGARYFVGQAMHHDHFFNYPSKLNHFNSIQMGPGKDICGLWKKAAEKYSLPFGLTEHLAASFSWWNVNKGSDTYGPYAGVPYDGCDTEYRTFYHANEEHIRHTGEKFDVWYTKNQQFHAYWLAIIRELIDMFQPDLLYSDGALPFGDRGVSLSDDKSFRTGLEAVAHLYNTSIRKHGQNAAVYCQKDTRPEIYRVGVLDIERSLLPGIAEHPWQTDTCIGDWFYNVRQTYKKPSQIIETLIDIVSKNGQLLLNIVQRPDGTLDDECLYTLTELASWFSVCAEGIYGTQPWRTFGEGDSHIVIEGFKEDKVSWNSSDFRFTKKGDQVYAFILCPPSNSVCVLKSFLPGESVKAVRLLGEGSVPFSQSFGVLTVKLPDTLPTKYSNCLAITI